MAAGQKDDHIVDFFMENNYFKTYYKMIAKMIAIDLSKQQALNADTKAIQ